MNHRSARRTRVERVSQRLPRIRVRRRRSKSNQPIPHRRPVRDEAEHGSIVILMRREIADRDDLLRFARRQPRQHRRPRPRRIEILQRDRVRLPRRQRDRTAVLRHRVRRPVADDKLVVNPQPHPVIAQREKLIRPARLRPHLPRPARRIRDRHRRRLRRIRVPRKIHRLINPREHRRIKGRAREIRPAQPAIRRIKLRRGHHFLRPARLRPKQLRRRTERPLEILHRQIVVTPRRQRDALRILRQKMSRPIVHQQLPIHPQPHALIRDRVELMHARTPRLHPARPAHREIIRRHPRDGRAIAPVEIHIRIYARLEELGQITVHKVFRLQARAPPRRFRQMHRHSHHAARRTESRVVRGHRTERKISCRQIRQRHRVRRCEQLPHARRARIKFHLRNCAIAVRRVRRQRHARGRVQRRSVLGTGE